MRECAPIDSHFPVARNLKTSISNRLPDCGVQKCRGKVGIVNRLEKLQNEDEIWVWMFKRVVVRSRFDVTYSRIGWLALPVDSLWCAKLGTRSVLGIWQMQGNMISNSLNQSYGDDTKVSRLDNEWWPHMMADGQVMEFSWDI